MDFHGTIVDGKNEKNPPPVNIGKFVPLFPSIYIYMHIYVYSYRSMGFHTCPAGFLPSAARLEKNPARPVPTIPLAESPRYHGVP